MDLPIDKIEFDYIVTALWKCRKNAGEPQCEKLYNKLRLVQEVIDANPDGPYKKILRRTWYGDMIDTSPDSIRLFVVMILGIVWFYLLNDHLRSK